MKFWVLVLVYFFIKAQWESPSNITGYRVAELVLIYRSFFLSFATPQMVPSR